MVGWRCADDGGAGFDVSIGWVRSSALHEFPAAAVLALALASVVVPSLLTACARYMDARRSPTVANTFACLMSHVLKHIP